eukprot:2197080-Prymnesium_polylepis.1
MYVNGTSYNIGKDPIAGGKKSYPGNPAVIRYPDGVLRNRGEYDDKGVIDEAESNPRPLDTAESNPRPLDTAESNPRPLELDARA